MLKHAPFRPHSSFSQICTALAIVLLCTSLAQGIASALGIGLASFALIPTQGIKMRFSDN